MSTMDNQTHRSPIWKVSLVCNRWGLLSGTAGARHMLSWAWLPETMGVGGVGVEAVSASIACTDIRIMLPTSHTAAVSKHFVAITILVLLEIFAQDIWRATYVTALRPTLLANGALPCGESSNCDVKLRRLKGDLVEEVVYSRGGLTKITTHTTLSGGFLSSEDVAYGYICTLPLPLVGFVLLAIGILRHSLRTNSFATWPLSGERLDPTERKLLQIGGSVAAAFFVNILIHTPQ
jgi:hypothetical protein